MSLKPANATLASIMATAITAVVCTLLTIGVMRVSGNAKPSNSEDTRVNSLADLHASVPVPQLPSATAKSPWSAPATAAIPQNSSGSPSPYDVKPEISKQDWEVLQDLPPVCTTDLKPMQQPGQPAVMAVPPKSDIPHVQRIKQIGQPHFDSQVKPAAFQQNRYVLPGQTTPSVVAESTQDMANELLEQAFAMPTQDFEPVIDDSYHTYAAAATRPAKAHGMPMHAGSPHAHASPHSSGATHAPKSVLSQLKSVFGKDDGTPALPSDQDPHAEIYSRDAFPSAKQCAQCHQQIYEEWASSSHAYASISPMFHVFEDTINRLSQGTIGYFCYRCHSPVSTTMGLRRDQPIWDGPPVFREGVTCVACHRVKIPYGKSDGERRIEPGDIYDPVYGAGDGRGVTIADKYREYFKVKTERSPKKLPGQAMHRRSIQFEELSKSSFCVSCHQVAVEPGIKLEVVWDQYRASPAYRQGITCQDCHMGRVPGLDEGYSVGPGAVVNDRVINAEKKHSNHIFYGPGYSIAHPGTFPHHMDADRWTVPQWLEFDWRAGWGTDAFEDALAEGKFYYTFPPTWAEVDDRYDAREIVDANLKKLEYKRDLRRQLMENGSKLDGPFFNAPVGVGQPLKFRYCLTNLNSGHNMPSGSLGAQPQIWMNVVLIGPDGCRLWESGYLDSNGDLADNHSLDVLARKVPLDTQLFNLQTKFLTTNVKGTDREMYLPVNFDIDQLPFLRPPQQPVSVINHPPFIRMEGHSIPPLGKRNAKFSIPSRLIQAPGTYRLSVRMRSRAEPIYFMRFCNATTEMKRMMNEWICDFHVNTVSFEVH